jgi:hypothetical protein
VLQAQPSYLAVLYHPNNTWWPTRILILITYSAIYDHGTILPASCYFIPLRSKHYLNTPPSHNHHHLSCRSCMSRTVSSCWLRRTTRFKEHFYHMLIITNNMQRNTIFFIAVKALHVSGGFPAYHQELNNYVQHLVLLSLVAR